MLEFVHFSGSHGTQNAPAGRGALVWVQQGARRMRGGGKGGLLYRWWVFNWVSWENKSKGGLLW